MIRINLNITIVEMVAQKKSFSRNSTMLVESVCFNEATAISLLSLSNKSFTTGESSWKKFSLERKLLQKLHVSSGRKKTTSSIIENFLGS